MPSGGVHPITLSGPSAKARLGSVRSRLEDKTLVSGIWEKGAMLRWAGAVLAVALIGGQGDAANLPLATLNGFEVGQTTKADVVRMLGPPQDERSDVNGRLTLIYTYTAPPLTHSPEQHLLVMVIFDRRGVMA